MMAWFLKLIGMNEEIVAHLNEVSVTFQRPAVLWVGLALLGPIAFFIYQRQLHNLGTTRLGLRLALSATRIAILLLLVLVSADPYLKIDHESEKKPIVAMLFDHSQSMALPLGEFESEADLVKNAEAAGYQVSDGKLDPETRKALHKISRLSHTQTVVQHSSKSLLEPLAKKYDVQYFSFSKELTPLGIDPAHPKLADADKDKAGTVSHLGDAIGRVLDDAGGRQIAGIVLFSDGENTGGRSLSEAAQAASGLGAPIFTVPTGSSKRLKDIAIVDVFTSGLVSVGDTVRVAVTLESQGFDKRPVKVELREGANLLDSKDLLLRSTEQQMLELTFQAKEPGAHYLTVTVPPQPEEPEYLRSNNSDIAFVRVSEEKLRVLYVDGLPRWDYRFLKNAMRRDHGLGGLTSKEPDILLEAELRRQPAGRKAPLPRTVKELAEYHTIILGDVSPSLLDTTFLDGLVEAVRDKGVGLIAAAGPLHMPHAYDKRLLELLPVRLHARAAGLEAPVTKLFRLELMPEGSIQEAMRFYDDPGRNQNAWSHLPPYFWCIAAERPAPGASVLVTNPSIQNNYGKLPLIASQYAGKGKVLLVGTDSTWLWRQNVGDRFFYKFWGQSIRAVARRDDKGAKKSWVEVHPVRAQPGEKAEIELMAVSADGSPRTEPTLPVRVVGTGSLNTNDIVELRADPSTKGRYTARHVFERTGEYRVAYDPGNGVAAVEARVRVMVAPEELRHPNVNRPALQALAANSGGKMVELPDLGVIPENLKGETKLTAFHREATLWDNWLTLAALVFIFSLDVGLRRLTGLS
jgi:hypothetical protein